jgi:DNA (cytosine-5)-methyltransferase 1
MSEANGEYPRRIGSPSEPTHLDLFSGIGGFALAAEWNGWRTIGFSEIDPFACKVLKRRWSQTPNYGNIRSIENVKADLVTGGFPCQPFSHTGLKKGFGDERYLWPEMLRVIREAQPLWVVGENVPGIIHIALDTVLDDLQENGYTPWVFDIPACAAGAPHLRHRIWIVAYSARVRFAISRANVPVCRVDEAPPKGWLLDVDRSFAASWEFFSPWPREPDLGRVVHGIPSRVDRDRIRSLGNAVVPQIPARLLHCIPPSLRMENAEVSIER